MYCRFDLIYKSLVCEIRDYINWNSCKCMFRGEKELHNFIIETERLILRPLCIEDCDAVFQWVSDDNVAKYMVYNTYKSKVEVIDWLTSLQEPDNEYHFGFERKEDNQLIGSGSIGPDSVRKGFWGFGYNLRKDCWGKGYATESTKAMMKFAYEHFGITKFSSSHVEQRSRLCVM